MTNVFTIILDIKYDYFTSKVCFHLPSQQDIFDKTYIKMLCFFFFQKLLNQNDPSCDCFMAFNNRLLNLNKKAKHIHCLTFSAPHSSISFEDKNIYGGNQNRLNLFKTVATVRLG